MGVYRRKDSPFYWLTFKHDGKRINESTGITDRKLARQVYIRRRNDYITRKETGQLEPIRLRELIDQFLGYSKANKRSYTEDLSLAKKVRSYFGEKLAAEVTPQAIEQLKAFRRQTIVRNHPLSVATVNRPSSISKCNT